jgi:hypothetical protein
MTMISIRHGLFVMLAASLLLSGYYILRPEDASAIDIARSLNLSETKTVLGDVNYISGFENHTFVTVNTVGHSVWFKRSHYYANPISGITSTRPDENGFYGELTRTTLIPG